ncbi:hypothetical protein Poly21_13400 [Allorhodopirellula heiligendammensis]|uniref:Cohesin domain-containing protein n=2 Tax=Allorhodopirellula heiligendammensis TaxID=2714739 RepID=A0A5C6C8S7_9BACT|nr:hypothetical protein Poly21_13400 [Allorhodopirellula heiligendammensis]
MAKRTSRLTVQCLESRRVMASVSMASAMLPDLSSGGSGSDGQTIAAEVSTPIEVTGADGMRAAEVRIQFDPSEVTTDASRIRSGDVWGGRAAVIANVNQEAGTIVAFVFSATPVATGDGKLIDIDFTPNPGSSLGEPIAIDVQKVRLNEGHISLTQEPIVGLDASDGRIETSGRPQVDTQPRRIRGSFLADSVTDEENCNAVLASSRADEEGEDTSWQGPQVQYAPATVPQVELQSPMTPQAVDDVYRHMFDSQSTTKRRLNVRATWHH